MSIIAFVGRIKSGKSTACDVLNQHGYALLNFADPLKQMTAQLLDIPIDWCYSQEQKELQRPFLISTDELCLLLAGEGLHPSASLLSKDEYAFGSLREVLQFVGSEAFRDADKDFWVNKLTSQLKPGIKYAISDCRFLNEVEAIKKQGGTVVFINRPGNSVIDNHQSEQIDDLPWDFKITNTNLNQFKLDITILAELSK